MARSRVDITTLQTVPTQQLRQLWSEGMGKPLPGAIGREFLLAMVAWHQQAQECGGLTHRTEAALRQFKKSRPTPKTDLCLPAGTVLLKTYRGTRYTVTVQSDGFTFEGTVYPSLSEIARRITGTRWNGPAFFGLRRTASKQNKEASSK